MCDIPCTLQPLWPLTYIKEYSAGFFTSSIYAVTYFSQTLSLKTHMNIYVHCICMQIRSYKYFWMNLSPCSCKPCVTHGMGTHACIHTPILDSCQDKLHISQDVPDYFLPLKYKAHMTVILRLKLLNSSNRAVSKLLYLQISWLQWGCNTKANWIPLQSWCTLILVPWQFWKQIADTAWMRLQQEEEKNNDCYPKVFSTQKSYLTWYSSRKHQYWLLVTF